MVSLGSAIVQALASVIAYFAARGLDHLLGKWIAYFTTAFEKSASTNALETFRKTREELVSQMPDTWKEWDAWRKKTTGV